MGKSVTFDTYLIEEFLKLSYLSVRSKYKNFTVEYQLNLEPKNPVIEAVSQDSTVVSSSAPSTTVVDTALYHKMLQHMTNGDSSSMKIDFVGRQSQQLHVRKRNDTECLVDLKGINIVLVHARMFQSLGNCQCGGGGEFAGLMCCVTPS